MHPKQKLLLNYQSNSQKALDILIGQGFIFLNSEIIWQILIYELDHHDIPTEVIFHKFSVDDIVEIISTYYDENGLPIDSVNVGDSVIPDEIDDRLNKAEIKFKGEVWTVHKNDKDTFPSNPHAHNYDCQVKLHLGNGNLYRKKVVLNHIKRKDLIAIRILISERIKGIDLPALVFPQ